MDYGLTGEGVALEVSTCTIVYKEAIICRRRESIILIFMSNSNFFGNSHVELITLM